ncbi:MAG: hypothetical protein E7573_01565 [Ruminococcaceae bacterium]|nr:hypothetical protein [Oscillospiraceae bacterium]MBR3597667.1 hypothetical protein [Clostridia bacterium]
MSNCKKVFSLLITFALVLSLTACFTGPLKYTSNIYEHTTVVNQGTVIPDVIPTNSQVPTTNAPVVEPSQNTETTAPSQESTTADVPEHTTAAQTADPSSWTTVEILEFVTDAVTKTKAYTSQVTVNHQESFTANVTKAPGGAMIKNIANGIIEGFIKPTDEVLTFKGGKTTTDEGELPLLLPKRGAFTLTKDGVANATAKKNGDNVVVKITLVKEMGTLTSIPSHHAASVGYLDIADVDLMGVKLSYLNITYTGTTAEFVINPNGYVVNADYSIPVHIACEGSAMGFNAEIECEGVQGEKWKINW